MPRAGPIRQILRTLSVEDLRRLRREIAPQVTEYEGDKSAFVGRLRHSLNRQMEDGEFSYEELALYITNDLSDEEHRRVSTKIRHVLEDIEISPCASEESSTSMREKWINSEIFQGLRYSLDTSRYNIHQEKGFSRRSVDLYVEGKRDSGNYVIETKLAGSSSSLGRVLEQVHTYNEVVPDRRRTFVCIVAERERHMPDRKQSVRRVINKVENEDRTEVVVKPPSELR